MKEILEELHKKGLRVDIRNHKTKRPSDWWSCEIESMDRRGGFRTRGDEGHIMVYASDPLSALLEAVEQSVQLTGGTHRQNDDTQSSTLSVSAGDTPASS